MFYLIGNTNLHNYISLAIFMKYFTYGQIWWRLWSQSQKADWSLVPKQKTLICSFKALKAESLACHRKINLIKKCSRRICHLNQKDTCSLKVWGVGSGRRTSRLVSCHCFQSGWSSDCACLEIWLFWRSDNNSWNGDIRMVQIRRNKRFRGYWAINGEGS